MYICIYVYMHTFARLIFFSCLVQLSTHGLPASAHAQDEWPMGDSLITGRVVNQAKTLEDRLKQAQYLSEGLGLTWPIALDVQDLASGSNSESPVTSSFHAAYSPWPVRYYVIQNGVVSFIAMPDENNAYDLAPVRAAIARCLPANIDVDV
jgi:Iodothyronine deiodinase